MAEVLRWLKSAASTPVGQLAARSLDVIDSALHVYSPDEVCFSFNGGKDSTVVFHMLRAACLRRAQADASVDEAGAQAAATALLQRVRMVYFEVEDNFPEVESFMKDTCDRYALRMQRLPPFKTGLMQLIADHGIRAVLIGTRATDPDGRGLEHFSPTTPGWPPMMRISPILRWDYAAVWNCLRGADLAFCSLYAQGYTSLGLRSTSVPNPALLVTPTAAGAGAGAAPAEAARAADSQPAGADTAASAASVANAAASAASVADTAAGAGTVADTAAGAGTVADTAAGAGTAAPGGVGRIDRAGPGSDAQTYLPAWELKDARLEREGRRKR